MRSCSTRRPSRTRSAVVVAVLGALVLLATACLPGADDQPKAGTGNASAPPAVFHTIRAAAHAEEGGYDRVVFEFADALPDWDVRYVAKPVLLLPSGQPTTLAGTEAIAVRMSPAAGQWSGSPLAYAGPTRFSPGTPESAELLQLQDFEGVLTWAIGVNQHRAFRVSTLTGPPRLVIDVAGS